MSMTRSKGFTLLEIMIALFIFTIIAMIMTSALHTILSSQTVTEKSATRLANLQIALLLMSRDIQQVIDRPVLDNTGKPDAAFLGTPNSMTFTHAGLSNPLGQVQRATLQRTRYRLENTVLIRDTWPILDQTTLSAAEARPLLTPISEIVFSYLDERGTFQSFWPPIAAANQNIHHLPKAVSVSLVLPNWGNITQLFLIPGQSLLQDAKP